MRIALELEFPDAQAASFVQLLALPGLTARFLQIDQQVESTTTQATDKKLSTAEEEALLHELFGAWKNGVSGEEMVREIYEARDSSHREVEL